MVVRVTVVDADQAAVLMQRVRREVDVELVEFEQARQQVRIDVEKNPDATNVEIDDHRYVLGAAG